MSIKCWTAVSVVAIAMASCMAGGPVLAKVTEKDATRCSALGNLTIHAMEFNAKGVPIEEAIAKAKELFEGEELKQVLAAIKAGYAAKETAAPLEVGTATFTNCMENVRLSTV